MDTHPAPKNILPVEIRSGDVEIRIEQAPSPDNTPHRIRLSNLRGGQLQSGHVELAEKELALLLARAIRAGILSPDFIRSLRAEFEI